MVELRPVASERLETINRNYLLNMAERADDLLDIVSGSPAMVRWRVLLTLPLSPARFAFFLEACGQALAKGGQIIRELLPGCGSGKCQLGTTAIQVTPPLADPLRTIQDKAAKFRQSMHIGTAWSTFCRAGTVLFPRKMGGDY